MITKYNKILFLTGALAALLGASCAKETPSTEGEELVISLAGDVVTSVEKTKATAISSVPSTLYWGATTGGNAAGTENESAAYACASFSPSADKIYTGHYQTYGVTTYNHYVSNASFSVGSSTTIAVPNNNTDIIAGRTAQTSSATPSVTLNHVFARTGSLTMNTQSGYNISVNWWSITGSSAINGTAGTYDMRTSSWTATSATLAETSINGSSDYYLIPGQYVIKCNYTLTKGNWYSETFTKSATVTLAGGHVNNITGTASGGSATEIVMSVSLTAWNSTTHTIF